MRAWLSVVLAALGFVEVAGGQEPAVPEGFTIEKVAGFPLLHRPIFAGFDETGVLYVGESSGENLKRDDMLAKKPHWISRLEDTDGDGVFDKSTKFVENITLPQGCLWYRGSLYAACPPSIWKFTDTDNDGKADQREEILTGFGFSGNACDTHGPFLSPTGRLYIVQGRHGHEFKDKEGQVYSKGKAGRIYSCRLDGSDVRVHAGGGFDNPVEVDFTEEGECIGTVNILYRDRGDCLMHWVEGGVYPREDQADCVAEFKWTGGLLGPIHNLGHVACSGITRYRGVHFGDFFFYVWLFTEFNTHKVRYAELKRAGSTFTADVHEFLTCADGDFHPTDVLEDADGSLLVVNTGGWFLNGCPTSRVAKPEIYGGIYRVRKVDGVKVADPRGKQLRLTKQSPSEWIHRLQDSRPAVREAAIELLSRYREEPLARLGMKDGFSLTNEILKGLETDESTIRAIWSLSRRGKDGVNDLSSIASSISLNDRPSVIQALIHAIGANAMPNDYGYPDHLSYLTFDANVPLAVETVRTMGRILHLMSRYPSKIGHPGSVLQLAWEETLQRQMTLQLLSPLEFSPDQIHEHAFVVALTAGGHREILQAALQERIPKVQRAALIALDQMDDSPLTREMVLPLLSSDDARLQQTALEVIARHPGWAAETLALLKKWVAEPELGADRANALRGFLLAQLGDPAVQGFVVDVLGDRKTADEVRGLFWEVLQRSTIATWPDAWNPLLASAMVSADNDIALAALRIITQRSLPGFESDLRKLAALEHRSIPIRCEAVTALGGSKTPLDDRVFRPLLQSLGSDEISSDEKAAIGRALGNGPLSESQLQQLTTAFATAGPLAVPVLIKAYARSSDADLGRALIAALLQSEAATSIAPDELAGILRKYPNEVRAAAQPLYAKLGIDPAAQQARLTELTPLLEAGDANIGRNVFFGKKANCSACHAVAGEGGRIGPHLTTIGASRSPKDLLEAIVFPSASFVNGYRPYVITTDDGKVVQGVISAETIDAITLRTQDLQEIRVRRDAIDEQREGTTSIMPKGLDTQLTPDELRHLLAYLQSRK